MTAEDINRTIRLASFQFEVDLENKPITAAGEELIKFLKENPWEQYYDPEDDCIEDFKLERFLKYGNGFRYGEGFIYCEFDDRMLK